MAFTLENLCKRQPLSWNVTILLALREKYLFYIIKRSEACFNKNGEKKSSYSLRYLAGTKYLLDRLHEKPLSGQQNLYVLSEKQNTWHYRWIFIHRFDLKITLLVYDN